MKKSLLILSTLIMAGGINAQTYLPVKDFQDQSITSGGWQSQVIISTPGSYDWITQDLGSPGNFYAAASGWNGGGADQTLLWLISPAMDLTSATSPALNFRNATNYSGPALALMISSDYDGTSNPTTQGTWVDISSSVNWSPGTFTWVDGGPIDLSAYNGSNSVYIAFVYGSDPILGAATWEIDEVSASEPAAPVSVSIYDIQNSAGPSPYMDSLVSTGGIITGVFNSFGNVGYFVQAGTGAWSGVYVADSVNIPARGDSVLLTGIVKEVFGNTQLENISSFSIVNSGNIEPASVTVSTANANMEDYEGVKVTVTNAVCIDPNLGFGEWAVNDGSDSCRVHDLMYTYSPVLNEIYMITGPMYYSYGHAKIEPRDLADITTLSGIEEISSEESSVYPNPSKGIINIKNPLNNTIEIYNTLGSLVMTTKSNKVSLKNGVYLIRVGDKTSRVVVM